MKSNFLVAVTRQSAARLPRISHRRFPKRRYADGGASEVAAAAKLLLADHLAVVLSTLGSGWKEALDDEFRRKACVMRTLCQGIAAAA